MARRLARRPRHIVSRAIRGPCRVVDVGVHTAAIRQRPAIDRDRQARIAPRRRWADLQHRTGGQRGRIAEHHMLERVVEIDVRKIAIVVPVAGIPTESPDGIVAIRPRRGIAPHRLVIADHVVFLDDEPSTVRRVGDGEEVLHLRPRARHRIDAIQSPEISGVQTHTMIQQFPSRRGARTRGARVVFAVPVRDIIRRRAHGIIVAFEVAVPFVQSKHPVVIASLIPAGVGVIRERPQRAILPHQHVPASCAIRVVAMCACHIFPDAAVGRSHVRPVGRGAVLHTVRRRATTRPGTGPASSRNLRRIIHGMIAVIPDNRRGGGFRAKPAAGDREAPAMCTTAAHPCEGWGSLRDEWDARHQGAPQASETLRYLRA